MKILSHRGYWKEANEKNTDIAFRRSFSLGFGTETDIRDYHGSLVVSHDIAMSGSIEFKAFIELASLHNHQAPASSLTLALNIKADGLGPLMCPILKAHSDLDCFVFDMSTPDMRSYFELGIPVFTRMSEVERNPVWFDYSAGVWLDSFESDWFDISTIQGLLKIGKRVCIVSPELHGRCQLRLWEHIKYLPETTNLMLCTDYPEQAAQYFRGK